MATSDTKITAKYFKFEVKGIYGEVAGVTSCDPGRLTVTTEEATQGDKLDLRNYTYGSHEYDDMTFTVQTGPGMAPVQEWCNGNAGGAVSAPRRDVSIHLLASDKTSVLSTITMFGCYPTNCYVGDRDAGSANKTTVFTCIGQRRFRLNFLPLRRCPDATSPR